MQEISDSKNDGKKLWKILNNIMGRNSNMHPSFIETEGKFITKPADIANHFNDYFTNKVDKLRNAMGAVEDTVSHQIVS